MIRVINILVMFFVMAFAGSVGSTTRSGQNSIFCSGHDGVFNCESTNPYEPCYGINAYFPGANQSGIKNKLPSMTKKNCQVHNNSEECIGTALLFSNIVCEEIIPIIP